jgi:hypothetical protein
MNECNHRCGQTVFQNRCFQFGPAVSCHVKWLLLPRQNGHLGRWHNQNKGVYYLRIFFTPARNQGRSRKAAPFSLIRILVSAASPLLKRLNSYISACLLPGKEMIIGHSGSSPAFESLAVPRSFSEFKHSICQY